MLKDIAGIKLLERNYCLRLCLFCQDLRGDSALGMQLQTHQCSRNQVVPL
jgi:hypothetical protein